MGRDAIRAAPPATLWPAAARTRWAAWAPHFAVAGRAFLLSRLIVWLAGAGAVALFGVSGRVEDFDPGAVTSPFGEPADTLAAPAARWDSVWLLAIANDGYGPSDDLTRPAFYPLYPALVKAGGAVLGSPLLAGLLISGAAFVVALAVLHRLATIELGAEPAGLAVAALALFPMSFFFTAVYSEALFLMLSVGAVYLARTGRWAGAGALGAMGAATRSAGVLLLVPLALLWWDARRRGTAQGRDAAWLALVPVGLAAFCVGLALAGHDLTAPFDAQDRWYRTFAGPFVGVWDGAVAAFDGARQLLSGSRTPPYFLPAGGDSYIAAAHNLELFGYLLVALPAVAGALRRLPIAYGAYVVAALALPLSWPVLPQPLMSLPRFEAVLFPLFLWLGWWLARGGRARRAVVLTLFGTLLAVSAARFATWNWVA